MLQGIHPFLSHVTFFLVLFYSRMNQKAAIRAQKDGDEQPMLPNLLSSWLANLPTCWLTLLQHQPTLNTFWALKRHTLIHILPIEALGIVSLSDPQMFGNSISNHSRHLLPRPCVPKLDNFSLERTQASYRAMKASCTDWARVCNPQPERTEQLPAPKGNQQPCNSRSRRSK